MSTPPPLVLDVRPLVSARRPPLPAILQAVNTLESGQSLQLIAPFEPAPLYALLAERGYQAQPVERPDGTWEILFTPAHERSEEGNR